MHTVACYARYILRIDHTGHSSQGSTGRSEAPGRRKPRMHNCGTQFTIACTRPARPATLSRPPRGSCWSARPRHLPHSPGVGYSGPPTPLKGLFTPGSAEKAKGSIPGGLGLEVRFLCKLCRSSTAVQEKSIKVHRASKKCTQKHTGIAAMLQAAKATPPPLRQAMQ